MECSDYFLSRLTVIDIPALEKVEEETRLAFWGEENYRRFLGESPDYFGYKAVVLEDFGEESLVGFYLARSLFEDLEMLKVGVSPGYQRHGIGRRLMESAYSEGIRRGCRRCFLEVRKSNGNAIKFYQNQKFRICGTRVQYYSDPIEDAWIMERPL